MKKITLLLLVLICTAFTAGVYQEKNSTAEVNQIGGIYIFAESKPVKDFEVIGEVRLPIASSNNSSFKFAKTRLIEMCKEKYPTAEGLIVDINSVRYTSNVIKFK